jgi:CheY-like chemotaxis protein
LLEEIIEAVPSKTAALVQAPGQGCKILVVDDSPIYRKLGQQSLSKEPHSFLFANNGREAHEVFAEHRPPLVITDWTMPDISGLELCQL